MSSKKFYLTTPLYYVNAEPHIGHSYTNISVDVLARYKRMQGYKVYFLTGTDEHGQKIERASIAQGYNNVKEFCDSMVEKFYQLWQILNISYDDFIRTTELRHEDVVMKILQVLYDKGEIYLSNYEGWYCTPCETFWQAHQVKDALCPDCKGTLEHISEKNYFLKVSKYRDWLKKHLKDNPDFILPKSRFNEIYSFLENPLIDLCISRPRERLNWGIEVPFSKEHITYVWFDALLNYITAPGFLRDEKKFSELWPADFHFIGKDILRYHAIYWPIMLHMLELELPRTIFAHGWWLVERDTGEVDKISKSKGNIVDPLEIVKKYSVDALRYFLLREVPFGLDGNFSEKGFIQRINSDLANDFGNLIHRTLNMLVKYYHGCVPQNSRAKESADEVFRTEVFELNNKIESAMEQIDYQRVLIEIWELIKRANKYIEDKAPWRLYHENKEELSYTLYNLSEILRIILISLAPFIPQSSQEAWNYLGYKDNILSHSYREVSEWGLLSSGQKVTKGKPLFPRI